MFYFKLQSALFFLLVTDRSFPLCCGPVIPLFFSVMLWIYYLCDAATTSTSPHSPTTITYIQTYSRTLVWALVAPSSVSITALLSNLKMKWTTSYLNSCLWTPLLPHIPFVRVTTAYLKYQSKSNKVWWFEKQRLVIFNFFFLRRPRRNLTYENSVLMQKTWSIVVHSLFYPNKIHGKYPLHHHHIL